jgi:hypothetical protein
VGGIDASSHEGWRLHLDADPNPSKSPPVITDRPGRLPAEQRFSIRRIILLFAYIAAAAIVISIADLLIMKWINGNTPPAEEYFDRPETAKAPPTSTRFAKLRTGKKNNTTTSPNRKTAKK